MNKTIRRKVGDVIQIDLPSGRYAYGRLYRDATVGVYKETTDMPGMPPIGSREFMFYVGIYDDVIKMGKTPIVGRDPFDDPDSEWPPPACIKDKISGEYSVYHRGIITKSNEKECQKLEPAAVWDLNHIIERIMANLNT